MHKHLSAAIGIVITLAACEQPTTPGDAALSRIGTNAAISEDGNVGAKGQGHAELPAGFGQSDFEFDAKEVGYGEKGAFRMFRLRNGLTSDFEGVVTCVSEDLENNRVWIGGVVTVNRSTDANQQLEIHQPGQDVWFRVVDNGNLGEGDGSTPDRITVLGFKGAGGIETSAQYCATRPWAAGDVNTFPLVDGDVKVRPN